MLRYPQILENPYNPNYNLEESEIYSFKETLDLIEINKYSYCLFAFWNAVVINLQRRIESFGIDIFINFVKEKEPYDKNANSLKERWLNINEYKIIEYAKDLNIINIVTANMIFTLFWMKSNTNEEENQNLSEQEILSIIYLIEKNLFLHEFKKDKRTKDPIQINTKMKFRRKSDNQKDLNAAPRTRREIYIQSGMKVFEEQNKKIENNHILDEYC